MRHYLANKAYLKVLSVMLSALLVLTMLPMNKDMASTESDSFRIIVTDSTTGNPIEGATVHIEWTYRNYEDTTTTDIEGIAEFSEITDYVEQYTRCYISYDVTFPGTGYQSKTGNIDLRTEYSNQATDLPVALDRSAISPNQYTVNGFSGAYDGADHGITVTVEQDSGLTVKYGETSDNITLDSSPVASDIGTTTVYYEISGPGYSSTVTDSADIEITKAQRSDFVFNNEFQPDTPVNVPVTYTVSSALESDSLEVTYSSDDESIATVDPTSGEVTFHREGQVKITAILPESEHYAQSEAHYFITGTKIDNTDLKFSTTEPEGGFEVTYADNYVFSNPVADNDTYTSISYRIGDLSDNGVASVDNQGNVSVYRSGTVIVEATVESNYYNTRTISYTLTVNRANQSIAFADTNNPVLEFNRDYSFTITGQKSAGTITYEVIDGNDYVAAVNNNSQIRVIATGGTARIRAYAPADEKYDEAYSEEFEVFTTASNQDASFGFSQDIYYFNAASPTRNGGRDIHTIIINNVASGGNSTTPVSYSIISSNSTSATIARGNNYLQCKLTVTTVAETFTIVATREADANYNELTDTATVVVRYDSESGLGLSVNPSAPGASGWYSSNVTINPNRPGYYMYATQLGPDNLNVFEFTEDGTTPSFNVYFFRASNDNYAGSFVVPEIKIDQTPPVFMSVSYSTSIFSSVINAITFGYYDAPVTVTVTAFDELSGIDKFVYYLDGEPHTILNSDIDFDANVGTASFQIEPQYVGEVHVYAYDVAGNVVYHAPDRTIVVDNIDPDLVVTYDDVPVYNSMYYNQDRTATIQIDETNFYEDEVNITVERALPGESITTLIPIEPDFTSVGGDTYRMPYLFHDDGKYQLNVSYSDRSGNAAEAYTSPLFVIDHTAPVLSVEYTDTVSPVNGTFYSDPRTAVFSIEEYNFDPSSIDFTLTAKDYDGHDVTLTTDYQEYLRDPDNWNMNTTTGVNTASVIFDADATYDFTMSYSDLANNAGNSISGSFTVDTTMPSSLNISYSQSIADLIIETLTFGFYKAPITVRISAVDTTSGIDALHYAYICSDDASSVNNGGSDVVTRDNLSYNGEEFYTEFTIDPEFRGYVSFYAVDRAGNVSAAKSDEENIILVADDIDPIINVSYDNNDVKNGSYFDAPRTVTIEVTEANFFEDIVELEASYRAPGTTTYVDCDFSDLEYVKNGDVYTAVITFAEDGDYQFYVHSLDHSQNVGIVNYGNSISPNQFTIDTVDPVIEVSYDNNNARNEEYFNADRTATITITDYNFNPDDTIVYVNGEAATLQEEFKLVTNTVNQYQTTYHFSEEDHYTFNVTTFDYAKNADNGVDYGSSAAPEQFTLDKSNPTDLSITIDNVSILSTGTVAFDTFYDSSVTVYLSANCDISGLESLLYQKVDKASDYSPNGEWTTYNAASGITISPSDKCVIFFKATDKAGNYTIVNSTGIVVDNQAPVGPTSSPEIDILPAAANSNGFYSGSVPVTINVVDPSYNGSSQAVDGYYSGLNNISYRIYTTDTGASVQGQLFDRASNTAGGSPDGDGLYHSWSGSITVDAATFNSNNVIVEVTAVDNAGNERTSFTSAGLIKIDTTAPAIEVSYNNNQADQNNFFRADRTATIVITERNFVPGDVKVTITSSNGNVPAVVGWSKSEGSGNGDDTRWIGTILYGSDADYTFTITYTDPAGNQASGVNYGGSVAPTEFTIDKTVPAVTVTYDNNNAVNGNYYNDFRTATISINEHNFDPTRVTVTLTATDDDEPITAPQLSNWTTFGDTHTATIAYNTDGRYVFNITVRDKAGNDSANYAGDDFYVDTTAPEIDIDGVTDNSANSGTVAPILTYSDTNFSSDLVSITLTGANQGEIDLDGILEEIHNGEVFSFNDFERIQENDDIYTLSITVEDLAGNLTTQEIVFSVNRFGSTYLLDDNTTKILGKYSQEPVNIIVSEINPNALTEIVVTVFKNNETLILEEGRDYDVQVTGGDGTWYEYTYVIHSDVFADDGAYRVLIHSVDEAGNVSENTLDTKNTNIQFGIDTTKPIINVSNLESHKTYAVELYTVRMYISDNLLLSTVEVYLDGDDTPYRVWTAEEVAEIIAANGEFTFDISDESNRSHTVRIVSTDAAGNVEETVIKNFYVTTNVFVRYYTNTPLFVGSIVGVVLLASLIVFIVVKRRNKKNR